MLFTSRIAAIVTIACAVVGGGALLGNTFALTLVEGSEFMEFALAMVFFVSFLVGAYWWIVFGPGRRM